MSHLIYRFFCLKNSLQRAIHNTLYTLYDMNWKRSWNPQVLTIIIQCKILLTTNFYFSLFGLRMRWCGYEWCVWDHCKWPKDQCILPSAVWFWLDGRYIYMFILAFFYPVHAFNIYSKVLRLIIACHLHMYGKYILINHK